MEHDFWHERWKTNQIGFHEGDTNILLRAHFSALAVPGGSRIFLPLCGKTRDIAWLMEQGYRVAGAELSAEAVRQLFEELNLAPRISAEGNLTRHTAQGLDIFVGDIFELTQETLGQVDATYDRAALVALPSAMRQDYAPHLIEITRNAPQFLITFTYDQTQMEGPPFSVTAEEVHALYDDRYTIHDVFSKALPGGMKGKVDATEDVWIMRPR